MIMPTWNHNPSSRGMTTREQAIVNQLHHLADGPLDPNVRPVVEGLTLIRELIEDPGKRRDFDECYDRPHDED
jgi:hypothetical protein